MKRDLKAPPPEPTKEERPDLDPNLDFGAVERRTCLLIEPMMPPAWKKALDEFIDDKMPWILFIWQDYGGPEIESYLMVGGHRIPLGLANKYREWRKARDG